MLSFISNNIATIVGSILVASLLIIVVSKMIRDSKNNKSGCGSGCSNCPNSGMCHPKSK